MNSSLMTSSGVRNAIKAALFLVAVTAPLGAADVSIKLATLVPDGSIWEKSLRQMADTWRNETDGRVTLRIYPGGVAGDENDVLRKIRIGQLHAGTFTIVGLSDLEPAFNVLGIPLFFDSYEELYHVVEELRPELERRLEAKGFVLVQWGYGGWVHFFSRSPVSTTAELQDAKIFVWSGDDEGIRWWKSLGYQPVALAATDIMTGLQTGMIDVIRTTPLAALSLQWFRQTPYMNELGLGPLTGATIVAKSVWNKISAEDRKRIMASAREHEKRLKDQIPGQDRLAVEQMAKRGLEVVPIRNREQWNGLADNFVRLMSSDLVPPELMARAEALRDAYRQSREAEEERGSEDKSAVEGDGG